MYKVAYRDSPLSALPLDLPYLDRAIQVVLLESNVKNLFMTAEKEAENEQEDHKDRESILHDLFQAIRFLPLMISTEFPLKSRFETPMQDMLYESLRKTGLKLEGFGPIISPSASRPLNVIRLST